MSNKLMNYLESLFSKNKSVHGEIRFSINLSEPKEFSFCLAATAAEVEWGDGGTSNERNLGSFHHTYQKPGIYHVIVRGQNVTDIDIPNRNLFVLDVTQCPTMEFIDCSENQISELDLRFCPELYEVYCAKNRITDLRLSKYKKLFYISCSHNELETVDLSGCPELVTFRCRKNHLRALDFKNCQKLVSVNVEGNRFEYKALCDMAFSLVKRPAYDRGFIVIERNLDEVEYDWRTLESYIRERGWCEI